MWHASVHRQGKGPAHTPALLSAALRALRGVGDRTLDNWIERSIDSRTVHVKLRVLDSELVDELVDIRGTSEAARRIELIRSLNPPHVHPMIGDW